ncbi:hypothetical protein BU17DRAFT_41988 [Hysterangium stoloniferum]|nr:hypothetical protein BU17DRAFT_41988 [Hysterangium stoloniferum]
MTSQYSDKQRNTAIAVIGSGQCLLSRRLSLSRLPFYIGLAGLTAAYLLSSSSTNPNIEFDVHLFEKARPSQLHAPSLGMDTYSISVSLDERGEQRIDVPMRSFQGGYYKQLIALYRRLGVDFRSADFTYSLSFLTQGLKRAVALQTYLIYNGKSGLNGVSFPVNNPHGDVTQSLIFKISSLMAFVVASLVLLFNYLRLLILASPYFRPGPSVTFREWTSQTTPRGTFARWTGFDVSWTAFTQGVLMPMFTAVCTATEDDINDHPMEEFLEYIWMVLGTHHYVVQNGVRDVVSRMSARLQHIHLSSSIVSIEADLSDSSKLIINTTEGSYPGFSHLIIATQANSAIPLLTSYSSSLPNSAAKQRRVLDELIECLRSFRYCKNIVINHTDETILPHDQRDRRDLNLVRAVQEALDQKGTGGNTVPIGHTMATHILARFKSDKPIYQTTNPIVALREDRILSTAVLERAVLTTESKAALRQISIQHEGHSSLGPLQGAGRIYTSDIPGIWVCGSYAYAGIPLLEGCVASARDVVEQGILHSEGVRLKDAPW